MSWFLVAMSAHIIWAAVNLADQYLVKKFKAGESSNEALLMFTGPCLFIVGGIIVAIQAVNIATLSGSSLLLLVASGALQVVAIWFYLNALLHAEASSVTAWFLLMPVFGYIGGFLILGEVLTLLQVLGIVVILAGALFFSVHYHEETKTHHIPWKMIRGMVLASLLLVLADIIFKKGSGTSAHFLATLGVSHIGSGIVASLLFIVPKFRKDFFGMLYQKGSALFIINFGSELATIAGNALKFLAILMAPVALVTSIEGYQPLIVYLMTIPMAYFAPKYFTVEKTRRHIALKIIGAILLIVGTYLLL